MQWIAIGGVGGQISQSSTYSHSQKSFGYYALTQIVHMERLIDFIENFQERHPNGVPSIVAVYIIAQATFVCYALELLLGSTAHYGGIFILAVAVLVSMFFIPLSSFKNTRMLPNVFNLNNAQAMQRNGSMLANLLKWYGDHSLRAVSVVKATWSVSSGGNPPEIGDKCTLKSTDPMGVRSCKRCCDFIQPPRTRHCKICGVCRVTYDHHCAWVGSCIHEGNYPSFVCFLIWSFSGLFGSVWVSLGLVISLFLSKCQGDEYIFFDQLGLITHVPESLWKYHVVAFIFIGILGLVISLLIGSLLYHHYKAVVNNATTYELFRKSRNASYKFPHSHINGPRIMTFLGGAYRNILFRVRVPALLDSSKSASLGMLQRNVPNWVTVLIHFVHVWCCFVVPAYWYISGEAERHNKEEVVLKNLQSP